MRAIYSFLILLFSFHGSVHAQSPDWAWAKSAGGNNNAVGYAICTDAANNSYVTGQFWCSTLAFGTDTLTNTGGSNVFVAKYDASGNVIWARSSSGNGDGYSTSVCTDHQGNVYVTGSFTYTMVFGTDTLTISKNDYDVFTVKYDSSGNVVWARCASNVGFIPPFGGEYQGSGIGTDAGGNVYVGGIFSDTIVFEHDTLIHIEEVSPFIVKYDASGALVWAKYIAGYVTSCTMSTDANGNSYITGTYSNSQIIFDNDTILNPSQTNNVFVAKYDSSGNVKWAKSAERSMAIYGVAGGSSITTDAGGNVLMSGYFNCDSISFGNHTFVSIDSAGGVFLVKYDPSGNLIWVKTGNEYALTNVTTDAIGDVYLTGSFGGSDIVFDSDTLLNEGASNFFILKYDASGNLIWAKRAGGQGYDQTYGISADAYGNVYVTGSYNSTVSAFGPDTLTDATISDNVFVAKLANPTAGLAAINPSSKIIIYPNPSAGNFYFSGLQDGNTIEIYNILGEKVNTSQANDDNYLVSLSGQSKGMYFYKISDKTTIQQGKIIKE